MLWFSFTTYFKLIVTLYTILLDCIPYNNSPHFFFVSFSGVSMDRTTNMLEFSVLKKESHELTVFYICFKCKENAVTIYIF